MNPMNQRYVVLIDRDPEADGHTGRSADDMHDGSDKGAVGQLAKELQAAWDEAGVAGDFQIVARFPTELPLSPGRRLIGFDEAGRMHVHPYERLPLLSVLVSDALMEARALGAQFPEGERQEIVEIDHRVQSLLGEVSHRLVVEHLLETHYGGLFPVDATRDYDDLEAEHDRLHEHRRHGYPFRGGHGALQPDVEEILARKDAGEDCTADESAHMLRVLDASPPWTPLGNRIALLFPLERDQWWSEVNEGARPDPRIRLHIQAVMAGNDVTAQAGLDDTSCTAAIALDGPEEHRGIHFIVPGDGEAARVVLLDMIDRAGGMYVVRHGYPSRTPVAAG